MPLLLNYANILVNIIIDNLTYWLEYIYKLMVGVYNNFNNKMVK
jgi:hypothetical protein